MATLCQSQESIAVTTGTFYLVILWELIDGSIYTADKKLCFFLSIHSGQIGLLLPSRGRGIFPGHGKSAGRGAFGSMGAFEHAPSG